MRVVVVGAGLGGLALAQALHRAGDDVTVLDRDPHVGATGGYRITLTPQACAVLRRHLDPQTYLALQARSASREAFRQFHFTDARLRVLSVEALPESSETLLVDRVPLRATLARGLEDRIRFGAEVTSVSTDEAGRPTAHLADGDAVTSDLLVGADGSRSVVAAALAGRSLSRPCGLDGVAGRVALDERTASAVPPVLRRGPAIAVAPGGVGMFLSLHDPTRAVIDPRLADEPSDTGPASLVWGAIVATERLPRAAGDLDSAALITVVRGLMDGWDEELRGLVGRSTPGGVAFFRFSAIDPDVPLTPWPAGRVTALGDAVHVMPPTAGQAGSTAIRDAGALAARLAQARDGHVALGTAIADFHRDMTAYAPRAVRESLTPVRYIRASQHPAGRALGRLALPAVASVTDRLWRARGRVG